MEIAANLCPISQPLDIIHELINASSENMSNLTGMVQEHFRELISGKDADAMIPKMANDASNYSLLKVSSASIVQDCIEDEFFQPFMKTSSGKFVNAGLWTRSLYDPKKDLNELAGFETDYSNLQVRKRMLAVCKDTQKPFIVALYRESGREGEEEWEKWRQETFKMNSLHNLIGIYEAADEAGNEGDEDFSCNLPTLHLLKRSEHAIEGLVQIEASKCEEIRSKLVDYLSACLKGNSKAAESLLLTLVSRPSMRVDGLVESLFIGKLSLNLCVREEDDSCAEELVKILKGLKPFVSGPVQVESSLEGAFTKESIYPRLNVQSGQLTPGAALQQPDGCVLVVDETKLSEGEFKDQAVCNLQALIDLIRQQHVNYDFGMQQVPLKTDMPVVIVSLKKKSVLPFDLQVDCDGIKAVEVANEDLTLFKSFLEHVRMLNCSVSEEMATFLEHDYIALRKSSPVLANGNPKMNEQEFHRLMNLARLRAVSHGHEQLSQDIWEQTKALYI